MNILIRPETSADHEAIRHVNRVAFGQDDEARLVKASWPRLRETSKMWTV